MFKQKVLKKSIISLFILSIFIGLFSFMNYNDFSKTNNINTISANENKLNAALDVLPAQVGPFFNHTIDDIGQYSKLINEPITTFVYRHSFNNTDEFSIVDNNLYSADQFYYLLGYNRLVSGNFMVPNFIYYIKQAGLWDSTAKGYYSSASSDLINNTEVKTSFDNALALLAIITGVGDYSPDVRSLIIEQWDALNNIFYDSTAELYNHTNSDLTNIKYTSDNLLIAKAAFNIVQQGEFNNTNINFNEFYTRGKLILEKINSSRFDMGLSSPSFFERNSIEDSDKYLLVNALAISTILDYNIASNYSSNSGFITQASRIYDFLKSKLYNSTYDMYNNRMDQSGSSVRDYNLHLFENSWMLQATLDLFKATGNITYYNDALQHFYGIENTLYDSINHGYNATFGPNQNTFKTFNGYQMLLSALTNFNQVYYSANLTLSRNQSSYMYLNATKFEVLVSLNYSMNFEYYSSIVKSNWSISEKIVNSPLTFILRYPNNTILNEFSASTNSSGQYKYNYNIVGLAPGRYKLSVLANKTGYCLEMEEIYLEISSGLYITNYQLLAPRYYQGEKILINVSIGSLRYDNVTVNAEVNGTYFNTESEVNINILNMSATYFLINLSSVINIPVGSQDFTIKLYNNSLVIASATFNINVLNAIEINFVLFNQYVIDRNPYSLSITMTNHLLTLDISTLHLDVTGDYINSISEDLSTIQATKSKSYSVICEPLSITPFGLLDFSVNISRDGISIYYETFQVEFVPTIKCNNIIGDLTIFQGNKPSVTFDLTNYNLTSQSISIKSNGKTVWTGSIPYGNSLIKADIDSMFWNPYSIDVKSYKIEIIDSNGVIITSYIMDVKPIISATNLFFFYVVPVVIPLGILIVYKHKEIEYEKRNI